ncbi:MAG: hypothetical protein HY063_11960 [Bacteroidetes bacterium]|nr:hypothetical protein [Bacteroidota bacterium]
MQVQLTFKDKDGFPFFRDGADVCWAQPARRKCILHFKNGEALVYGHPLNYFHKKKVWALNLFRRFDKFLLLNISQLANGKWLFALLKNGKMLPLTRSGSKKLKRYLLRHKNSEGGNP